MSQGFFTAKVRLGRPIAKVRRRWSQLSSDMVDRVGLQFGSDGNGPQLRSDGKESRLGSGGDGPQLGPDGDG